jgi:hypothetical protein
MEGIPRQTGSKAETSPITTEATPGNLIEIPPVSKDFSHSEDEFRKIDRIKEALLERGALIIEPLKGDPFVLSREHISTGEGVTIYKPDKTTEKMSMEEYDAQLRAEKKAVQFFSHKSAQHETPLTLSIGLATRAIGWFKSLFSRLWSRVRATAKI